MEEKIKEIIETIRPYINSDGGDVEYVKYEDKYVFVKLIGACAHCAFGDDTLQNLVFESLKAEVPEIKGIVKVDI